MKMMNQKAYFKKVMLLLLLLAGSIGFSFSVLEDVVSDEQQELSVSAEFSEDLQDLRDGFLPGISLFKPSVAPFASAVSPYIYLSRREAKSAAAYLMFSRNIDPALDVVNIIYPFHSFL